jgi:hypothetical protein
MPINQISIESDILSADINLRPGDPVSIIVSEQPRKRAVVLSAVELAITGACFEPFGVHIERAAVHFDDGSAWAYPAGWRGDTPKSIAEFLQFSMGCDPFYDLAEKLEYASFNTGLQSTLSRLSAGQLTHIECDERNAYMLVDSRSRRRSIFSLTPVELEQTKLAVRLSMLSAGKIPVMFLMHESLEILDRDSTTRLFIEACSLPSSSGQLIIISRLAAILGFPFAEGHRSPYLFDLDAPKEEASNGLCAPEIMRPKPG